MSPLDPGSVLNPGVRGELVIPSRDYPVGCWSCGPLPPPPPLSFPFLAALPGSWRVPSGSSRSAGRGSERSRGVWNIPDPPGVTPAGRGRERLPWPVPACRAKFGRRAERRDGQVGKSPGCSLGGSIRLFFFFFWDRIWDFHRFSCCPALLRCLQCGCVIPGICTPGRSWAQGSFIPGMTRSRLRAGVEQLQVLEIRPLWPLGARTLRIPRGAKNSRRSRASHTEFPAIPQVFVPVPAPLRRERPRPAGLQVELPWLFVVGAGSLSAWERGWDGVGMSSRLGMGLGWAPWLPPVFQRAFLHLEPRRGSRRGGRAGMDLPAPPSSELPSIPAWKTARWGISWRSKAPEGVHPGSPSLLSRVRGV